MVRLFASATLFLCVAAISSTTGLAQQNGTDTVLPKPKHATEVTQQQLMRAMLQAEGSIDDSQSGCPVHIVQASYERSAQMMLTAAGSRESPTLHLTLSDMIEPVRSVEIAISVRFKQSPYQIDTETREINIKIDDGISGSAQVTKTLTLPENTYGLARLTLKRVEFVDGSMWRPVSDRCHYSVGGNILEAK